MVFLSSFRVLVVVAIGAFGLWACSSDRTTSSEVIVYASVDRAIAEPILDRFEQQTSIKVRAVFDTEANKTTGLVNRLIAEASRPQADVFWSGEIGQTVRLSRIGMFAPYKQSTENELSRRFVAADNTWHAFSARARVLLVNTEQVAVEETPQFAEGLVDERWKDRIAIADPHFGTTGTHLSALLQAWGETRFRDWLKGLRENRIRVLPGNAQVRDAVVNGLVAAGLTDSDDAAEAVSRGAPVRVVYLRQSADFGVVMIPNTVALVRGAANVSSAARLADYLLSQDTESQMVAIESAFFPTRPGVGSAEARERVTDSDPKEYETLADAQPRMLEMIETVWLQGNTRSP